MKFTWQDKIIAITMIVLMISFFAIPVLAVAPTIAINSPENRTYTNDSTPDINLTILDTDGGDVWVATLYFNETNLTHRVSAPQGSIFNLTPNAPQSNGRYVFWVSVTDSTANNVQSDNYSIYINNYGAFNGTGTLVAEINNLFVNLIGGTAWIAIFILIGFLSYLAIRHGVDFGMFGIIIIAPILIVAGHFGYLGGAAWLAWMGYILIAFMLMLALYKVFSRD